MPARRIARYFPNVDNQPGWFNMAGDRYSATLIPNKQYCAALRFYTFSPAAVSIGTHQPVESVNIESCAHRHWDVVVRPTGGRTLLHSGDLSYSVVIEAGDKKYDDLRFLYEGVAKGIIHTLNEFNITGVNSVNPPSTDLKQYRTARLCLMSRTRGEIQVSGRKIAASAQRVYKNSVLQHGSLLISGDAGMIAEVLNPENGNRVSLKELIRDKTVTLEELVGFDISKELIAKSLSENFARELGLQLVRQDWTDQELSHVENSRDKFEVFTNDVTLKGYVLNE